MLKAHGVDAECLDEPQIDQIARQFESAVRTLDEDFRIYQYAIKRDHKPIPRGNYENPLVGQAVGNRMSHLFGHDHTLASIDLYFAIAYEGLGERVWHRPT